MRNVVTTIALGVLMTSLMSTTGRAQNRVSAADQNAIQTVIGAQLKAFRRDDAAAAFQFASPKIQSLFGDANHFMAMVQQSYRAVYRPRETEFQTLDIEEGQVVQHVRVVAQDGSVEEALYFMTHAPAGPWRIDGCILLASPDVSAARQLDQVAAVL